MITPGFSAEASLRKRSGQYRAVGVPNASPSGWVTPTQLGLGPLRRPIAIDGGVATRPPTGGATTARWSCSKVACQCSGHDECDDLFSNTNLCYWRGGECDESDPAVPKCWCLRVSPALPT
jgi:hypothetical protein